MLDSVSSIAAFATQMSQQKTANEISFAVMEKAQNIEKQQGQAALALINSAVVSANKVDVYV